MIAAIHLTLAQVAATLALVCVAALVSVWQRADLERDIAVATVRSFVQLTAIGYVIKAIFVGGHDKLREAGFVLVPPELTVGECHHLAAGFPARALVGAKRGLGLE